MVERPWLAHYPAGVDWHVKITPRPLWYFLNDTIAQFFLWILMVFLIFENGSNLNIMKEKNRSFLNNVPLRNLGEK